MSAFSSLNQKNKQSVFYSLTVFFLFFAFVVGFTSTAMSSQCLDVYKKVLVVDSRYPQIGLYKDRYFYTEAISAEIHMGYEFLKGGAIFASAS